MSDGEQDYAAWRAEHHHHAQAQALAWAERASSQYGQAIRHEDDARARQHADNAWQRDRMAEERRLAQFHGVRSTEAVKIAEMWASVARALADGELPITTVIETRGPHDNQGSLSDALADPGIVGRFHAG